MARIKNLLEMKRSADRTLLEAMDRFGGSFVRRLAFAWSVASPEEAERLRKAFPDIVEKYSAKEYADVIKEERESFYDCLKAAGYVNDDSEVMVKELLQKS